MKRGAERVPSLSEHYSGCAGFRWEGTKFRGSEPVGTKWLCGENCPGTSATESLDNAAETRNRCVNI